MDFLRELDNIRQVDGEPKRRWFTSSEIDLIVWFDGAEKPVGFQLCYDKGRDERAFTWREGRGYDHAAVDEGDRKKTQGYKGTPILVADGTFEHDRVKTIFMKSSSAIPDRIREFVVETLERCREGKGHGLES